MLIRLKMVLQQCLTIGINLALLAASGCQEDKGPLIQLDLFYVNKTAHQIVIKHFARDNNVINSKVPQTVTLESGDTASFYSSRFESTENSDLADFDEFIIQNRLYDSAYVVLNDERYIAFSKGKSNEGIFTTKNFQGEEVKDNEFKFYYEFTEEDYNNAEEVGG